MAKRKSPGNLGFDGRTFLTEAEWQTYLRRGPVRYTDKPLTNLCGVCGLPADQTNPFTNAHRIAFWLGVVRLALTPDFLDSHENLVTAHRTSCNRKAECELEEAMEFLSQRGETQLPAFLPAETRSMWERVRAKATLPG